MYLAELFGSQFGAEKCKDTRTRYEITMLCRQFHPCRISRTFNDRNKRNGSAIRYVSEPWFDEETGKLIGVSIHKETIHRNTEIPGRTRSKMAWLFRFEDELSNICLRDHSKKAMLCGA